MINQLRQKINRLDERIIRLLKKRMAISKELKKEKAEKNFPISDKYRERELLDFWLKTGSREKLSRKFIVNFCELIIKESKRIQNE